MRGEQALELMAQVTGADGTGARQPTDLIEQPRTEPGVRRFLQVQMKAGDDAEMKLRYGVEAAKIQKPQGMMSGKRRR